MSPDSLGESPLACHLEAIVFGGEHREELTPPGEYGLQEPGFCVGKDAWGGLHGSRQASEDEGVDLVGFGELADGFGEIASLSRVDHDHGDPGGGDRSGGQTLKATGGLQDDQLRAHSFEVREELVNTLLVIGEYEGFSLGQEAHVEGSLGNVDANMDFLFWSGTHCMADPSCWCRPGLVDSGLLSRARALAPATVRAPPKSGRDDGCCSAVLAKPGPRRNRSVAPMLAAL